LDANNQDMTKTGKPGILHIKSPINMLGYLDNTKATSATLDTTTNWLNTGDMAHFSAASSTPTDNRLLCITSRAKDMIKLPGGWQLSPTELEYCLVAHPLIHDVAVFGFTSASTNTEIPIAHVVLKSGKVPTFAIQHLLTAQLKQYCGQTLAKYKVMDLEVRFVQGIVRSAAGKVLRGELREKEVRFRVVRDWLDGMEGV
jgi:acyl-CoA synthetase (AMP-forming)/AMP-acid ligase II